MSLSADFVLLIVITGVLAFRLFSLLGKPSENTVPPEVKKAACDAYHKFVADNKLTFTQEAEEGLKKVLTAHPFPFPDFIVGAKKAFQMVMDAFSKAELVPLKNLLSPALYTSFEKEIKSRETKKQTAEFEFIRFKKIELSNARLSKSVASLTLVFDTEQVNLLKDAKGKVIKGSSEMIEGATDTWTFSKDMAKEDPVWKVVAVQ